MQRIVLVLVNKWMLVVACVWDGDMLVMPLQAWVCVRALPFLQHPIIDWQVVSAVLITQCAQLD